MSGIRRYFTHVVRRTRMPRTLDADSLELHSFKTALSRNAPSLPARELLPAIEGILSRRSSGSLRRVAATVKHKRRGSHDILDFGCGRGRDVEFFSSLGYDAAGYDPHGEFGYTDLPARRARVATCLYVLNVIPTRQMRVDALRTLAERLLPGGYAFLVARSRAEISGEAERRGWKQFGDGFISDPRKETFQTGLTTADLKKLAADAGLGVVDIPLPRISGSVVACVRKPLR